MEHGNNLDRTALVLTGDMKLQGYTSIWMLFIYGSAVFLEPIHDIIKQWRWQIRGLIWVVIIWGIEYTSGLVLTNILEPLPGSTPDRLQWTILWGWIMHLRGLLQDWYLREFMRLLIFIRLHNYCIIKLLHE